MKKVLLILASISSSLFAQTISYSYSNEFETVKKHRDKGFYKFSNDQYAEVYLQKDEKDLVFQMFVGSSRVDLQACKLEYSIVSPK